jgi:drug/metabolite transporter (DMT)-like permease
MLKSTSIGRLEVLVTAVLFSTGGAVIKSVSMSGWQVAGFRSVVAAAFLFLALPSARRGWTWRTLVVGAAYSGALISYVLANKLTTAANTIFLYSTAPLYILVLGPLVLREPVRKRDLWVIAALAAGMSLFFLDVDPATATAPRPMAGNLLAALGGFFWALVVVGLRWLGRDRYPAQGGPVAAVVAGNLITAVVCLPMALPVASSGTADWLLIGYLGVIQVGLAYMVFTRALGRLPALEVSLLLLIEPVLNPLWAWWIHGEIPGLGARLGGLLIVLATAVASLIGGRQVEESSSITGQ